MRLRNFTCATFVAGLALVAAGCTETTTRKDVAEAQRDVREEQQDVREAAREGQQEVAAAQRDAQHTVNRPVMEANESVADANRNVAEARREASQEVAAEQRDVREATTDLQKKQRELQSTQARDAFANDSQMKLDAAEKQIEQLESQARSAEGAAKDSLNDRIKALKTKHDAAEDALGELKRAELDKWSVHQSHVQTALQDLTRDLNANR